MSQKSKVPPLASMYIRDFRNFVTARLFMTIAIQVQAVAVGWQIYEITRDPLSLGLIGLSEAIPAISVALYAGHLADVMERKKIILLCASTLLICSVALFAFTSNLSSLLEVYGAIPIYAVMFVTGIARGFLSPANFSLLPQLIPRALYTNAITWNSTIWEGASVAGPAIGGLLIDFIGLRLTYFSVMMIFGAGLFFYALVDRKPVPSATDEQSVWEKISAGLKFVFSHQLILSAITLDLFAVLFGGAVALLPVFAKEILDVGPHGFGLLRAAPAAGALVMALILSYYPIQKYPGRVLLWCVAGFGLSMVGFALSENFLLSLALLVISGVFDCVSVIIRGIIVHTQTPENMKGRVAAINSMFIGSSNEIGAFESGVAARWMGVVPSVVFGGIMTMVVTGATAFKAEHLRKIRLIR
ncbi:MAG: MFS transporter [Bacteroidetes bacterium]|nr:MFS transporter [Bacteroidota bacterium]